MEEGFSTGPSSPEGRSGDRERSQKGATKWRRGSHGTSPEDRSAETRYVERHSVPLIPSSSAPPFRRPLGNTALELRREAGLVTDLSSHIGAGGAPSMPPSYNPADSALNISESGTGNTSQSPSPGLLEGSNGERKLLDASSASSKHRDEIVIPLNLLVPKLWSRSGSTGQRAPGGTSAWHSGRVRLQMRHVALFCLLFQTVGAILLLRVSRTTKAASTPYLMTTAVLCSELVKLVVSFLLVLRENKMQFALSLARLHEAFFIRKWDLAKIAIPGLLYTVQNNLLFIALNNVSGAVYQVTYQLKILTTALLSVIILKQHIPAYKWFILLLLTAGVVLVQLPTGSGSTSKSVTASGSAQGGSAVIGVSAVLAACVTSGVAGVWLEKMLKKSDTTIWVRNVQLASIGAVMASIGVALSDGAAVRSLGFFQGYNKYTILAILMQSAGGIIVALVLKYADNILKCFANALAIAFSCLLSYWLLHDFTPTPLFFMGTVVVVFASYAWGANINVAEALKRLPQTARRFLRKILKSGKSQKSRNGSTAGGKARETGGDDGHTGAIELTNLPDAADPHTHTHTANTNSEGHLRYDAVAGAVSAAVPTTPPFRMPYSDKLSQP